MLKGTDVIELSEKLKGKSEFFCYACYKHHPISALGKIITTPKKENYQCNKCNDKALLNIRVPSKAKFHGNRGTRILKDSVDKYVACLNLKGD